MKHFYIIFIFFIFFMTSILNAQIHWTKDTLNNPVLTPGPAGEWDEQFAAIPSVLFDGSTYHLWYNNYNFVANSIDRIGYATSNDGIIWQKYDDLTTTNPPYSLSDPVLVPGPGNYDNVAVGNHCVRKFNNIYHMWYTGDNNPAPSQGYSICHATSSDGIHWMKDTLNPVLEVGSNGEWDDVLIFAPSVVFDGSIYHIWYSGWDGSISPDRMRIGHATKSHLDSAWTKDPGNPVLDIGISTCWDYDRVDAPDVVFDGTMFHMFYSGGPVFIWRIGYAWSTDGTHWTKYDNPNTTDPLFSISDPVLFRGSYGTWDGINVSHSSVLLDTTNNRFKMWYTGADAVPGTAQVGYATAPIEPPDGINEFGDNFLYDYVVNQNYPNPFNPKTNIEFTIPKSENVTLRIYNLLGQEVSTLVSEKLIPGDYKYTWDASHLASGMYFYKLQTESYSSIKKLILLR